MELIILENLFILFFWAIIIDFLTGVLVGAKEGKLKSRTCSNGIFRTMGEFIILTIFLCIDYIIPGISGMLSTFIIAFVFKEGLSIMENLIKLDVYIPNSIKKMLEVGVEKAEKPNLLKWYISYYGRIYNFNYIFMY